MSREPPIPRSLADIDSEWMRRALAAGGLRRIAPLKEVSVRDLGDQAGALASLARCRLAFDGESCGLPRSVIVKLRSPFRRNRFVCRLFGLYEREYGYYRRVAPERSVASPTLHYGRFDPRGHRFVLVLEDLRGMQAVDQLAGPDESQTLLALRSIAALHARYWNRTSEGPVLGMHDATSGKSRWLTQLLYRVCLPRTLARLENELDGDSLRILEAYGPRLAAHHLQFPAGSKTFIHGDFRIENMFFGRGGSGRFSLIDWQASGIGGALYDVAYFLSASVPTELRRRIERRALREYHDALSRAGVRDLSFEGCWERYRSCMLSTLMPVVGAWGALDLANERQAATLRAATLRTLAAIADLGAEEFLPPGARRPGAGRLFAGAASGLARLKRSAGAIARKRSRT